MLSIGVTRANEEDTIEVARAARRRRLLSAALVIRTTALIVGNTRLAMPYAHSEHARQTVEQWTSSNVDCHRMLRMEPLVFRRLCAASSVKFSEGMEGSLTRNGVQVEEGIATFLLLVGHGATFRYLSTQLRRSTETIHRSFTRALAAILT